MDLCFFDESGRMVGSWVVSGISQYYMIVKYELKGYGDQSALPNKHQTLIHASVEAVEGDIGLKF